MTYLVKTLFSSRPGFVETDAQLNRGQLILVRKEFGEVPVEVVGVWRYNAAEVWEYGGAADHVDLHAMQSELDDCLGYLKREGRERLQISIFAAESTVDRQTIQAYFVAEGRVDFRDLVRDFQRKFGKRLRLWQVGVRDRSQMVGGVGVCGKELCCHSFLKNFESVTVNMAKDQGLLLSPEKITGVCGRLLCCLRYEYHWYCEIAPVLPDSGSRCVVYKDGQPKEVRLITRNAVLGEAYVSDEQGTMFWVDFEDIAGFKEKLEEFRKKKQQGQVPAQPEPSDDEEGWMGE
ncbi:hypothetical protein HPY42_02515 [Coprothermobacteraceae bacterium]|nr:hypothetical protein [Coprothermobacteraceae bacterium]